MHEFNQQQEQDFLTVTDALVLSQKIIEQHFSRVNIIGEISNLVHARSGHIYFSLKDTGATLRCAFFKNRQSQVFNFKEGDALVISGKLTLYPARGDFQCVVEHIRPHGEGELKKQFLILKAKLEQEGYFLNQNKQALPPMPQSIGLVTSTNAAALHDMITTFKRLAPYLRVVLYPCQVQGMDAAKTIADMIKVANQRKECEVLIVARGGGSIEDLWAFNELAVCDAIKNSTLPIIAGIGHETDTTLADLIADRRAPTPTAAAEMVAPSITWIGDTIRQHLSSLHQRIDYLIQQQVIALDRLEQRVLTSMRQHSPHQSQLNLLCQQLKQSIQNQLRHHQHTLRLHQSEIHPKSLHFQHQKSLLTWQQLIQRLKTYRQSSSLHLPTQKLQQLMRNLQLLSPDATLRRGYLKAEQNQKPLHQINKIDPDHPLHLINHDHELIIHIACVEKN